MGLAVLFAGLCWLGAAVANSDWAPTPLGFFVTWVVGGVMTVIVGVTWRLAVRARAARISGVKADHPQEFIGPEWRDGDFIFLVVSAVVVGFGLILAFGFSPSLWIFSVAAALCEWYVLFTLLTLTMPQRWPGAWGEVAAWFLAALVVVPQFLVAIALRSG